MMLTRNIRTEPQQQADEAICLLGVSIMADWEIFYFVGCGDLFHLHAWLQRGATQPINHTDRVAPFPKSLKSPMALAIKILPLKIYNLTARTRTANGWSQVAIVLTHTLKWQAEPVRGKYVRWFVYQCSRHYNTQQHAATAPTNSPLAQESMNMTYVVIHPTSSQLHISRLPCAQPILSTTALNSIPPRPPEQHLLKKQIKTYPREHYVKEHECGHILGAMRWRTRSSQERPDIIKSQTMQREKAQPPNPDSHTANTNCL